MIIEFYTPDGSIGESIIPYVRDEILKLHKQHKNISRADISFRQKKRQSGLEKYVRSVYLLQAAQLQQREFAKIMTMLRRRQLLL